MKTIHISCNYFLCVSPSRILLLPAWTGTATWQEKQFQPPSLWEELLPGKQLPSWHYYRCLSLTQTPEITADLSTNYLWEAGKEKTIMCFFKIELNGYTVEMRWQGVFLRWLSNSRAAKASPFRAEEGQSVGTAWASLVLLMGEAMACMSTPWPQGCWGED